MNKKIVLALVILAVLAASFGAFLVLRPTFEEVELKYDDGRPDGSQGLGGEGQGYLVEFWSPAASLTVTKVRMFGKLSGSGYENRTFDVLIWDKDQKELYSGSFAQTKFSLSSGWVDITIPQKVVVGDNFNVVVITNTPREGGVYLHFDSSVKNEHSGLVRSWEKKDWYLEGIPEAKTNWMIRVVGTIKK